MISQYLPLGIRITAGVFLAVLFVFSILFGKYVKDEVVLPNQQSLALFDQFKIQEVSLSQPGLQAMENAEELLAAGEFNKAREKLLFVTNFYSQASYYPKAKKLVGEMNIDRVFSPLYLEGKELHLVERGDSLLKIANKYDSKVRTIQMLNGMNSSTRLQPGQELTVLPLNFEIKVSLKTKELELWREKQFIKSYPIKEVNFKPRKSRINTSVNQVLGYDQSKTYSERSRSFPFKKKLILIAGKSLQIRPVRHPDEDDYSVGFFLLEEDLEELALLLKSGNRVEIEL